jgi:tRNA pseudouridine55 synthase
VTDGVLVIDKPTGMTSHDVVDSVRRRLGTRKVGHAGTLDPDATGVLVVGVGSVTRLLSFAGGGAKRYRATAILGVSTYTQDASGEVVERRSTEGIGRAEVERALTALTGEIEQIPPMVSAVKVGGERLHAKARRGEEVERAPRRITVYELMLSGWRLGPAPEADLEVRCSAGTYVRTLVHDLGEALGCGAHVGALRRIDSGGFTEAEAISLDEVAPDALMPAIEAVRHLSRISVDADGARAVSHGGALPGGADALREGELVAVVRDGHLLAVYVRRGSQLVPQRVLPSPS